MAVNLFESHRPREATITVSLGPDFSGDFIGDGVADDVEINAAISLTGSFESSGIDFSLNGAITAEASGGEKANDLSGHSGTVTVSTGTLNTTGGDLLVEVDDDGSDTGGFLTI